MRLYTLDEVVAIYGPQTRPNDLPAVIPSALFEEVAVNAQFMTEYAERLRAETVWVQPHMSRVLLHLGRTPAFAPGTLPLPDNQWAIAIPLGLFARMRVLLRLLLRFWDPELRLAFSSPTDDPDALDGIGWIPPKLRPIFGGPAGAEELDDSIWADLAETNAGIGNKAPHDQEVARFLYLMHFYMFAHELAHVIWNHHAFAMWALQPEQQTMHGLDEVTLRRGLEIQADIVAARITIGVTLHQAVREPEGSMVERMHGITRDLSFALAVLFGAFDAHLKLVRSYDHQHYPHPIIRREVFFHTGKEFFWATAADMFGPEAAPALARTWEQWEVDGLDRAIFAFNALTAEAWQGVYGKMPPGAVAEPLGAINYGTGQFYVSKVVNGRTVSRLFATQTIDDEYAILQHVVDLQTKWGQVPQMTFTAPASGTPQNHPNRQPRLARSRSRRSAPLRERAGRSR